MNKFSRFFSRLGIYRDVKRGWITGVCAGIAERLTIKPIWVRILFIVVTALPHIMAPIIIYLLLAFLIKPRDAAGAASPAGVQMAYRDLAESVTSPLGPNPGRRMTDLKARFASLDARLNNLEAAVMSDELSLRRKFRDIGG
jgi:phage shock protein C